MIERKELSTLPGDIPVFIFMPSTVTLDAAVELQSKMSAISILCVSGDLGYAQPMDGFWALFVAGIILGAIRFYQINAASRRK